MRLLPEAKSHPSESDLELLSELKEELSFDSDVKYVRENLLRLLLDRRNERLAFL